VKHAIYLVPIWKKRAHTSGERTIEADTLASLHIDIEGNKAKISMPAYSLLCYTKTQRFSVV
jgi:hypothetical protein